MSEETERERLPMWLLKTAGYGFLAVFAGMVAVNAVQSFFWESVNYVITGVIAGAMALLVAWRRRKLLDRPSTQETAP